MGLASRPSGESVWLIHRPSEPMVVESVAAFKRHTASICGQGEFVPTAFIRCRHSPLVKPGDRRKLAMASVLPRAGGSDDVT
jgi:hypothetical protein